MKRYQPCRKLPALGVGIEIAEIGVGQRVAGGAGGRGGEGEGAVDGRDVVLVFAAAHGHETGLQVVIAEDLREVVLELEDAVEVVEVQGRDAEAVYSR